MLTSGRNNNETCKPGLPKAAFGVMGISITFIGTYLLGGLTFLPAVLILVFLHAYFTFPLAPSPSASPDTSTDTLRDPHDDGKNILSSASTSELAEKFQRRHEPDVAAGYFAVCREYVPGGINGKPPERTTPAGAVVATESPSVYQSMYRSIFDRKQGPSLDPAKGNGKTAKRARNVFFVVLRHKHLMLYEDSEQMEVKYVISLEHHDVSIYGGGDTIPEGELWIKKNAIRLAMKPGFEDSTSMSKPFFLFSENCSDKEDFYFALLQNQEVTPDAPDNPPRPQQYETEHIIGLVQRLHSSEEHLQTRWINGLVGRLFLALYKTHVLEDFIRKKITKKIARVKKPAFLSGIVLQKIDMGDSAPSITNPKLKDLTIDGDCCAEADFKYSGNFRLEVAATAKLDLGARFKVREVNLVLAVVVKKLNGHALLKFKPPPSNRVWISFETMPDMELSIEPIVSSRQITYSMVLRAIESRIREVMAETIVLPHWDDSPFTDTTAQKFRGGIWADSAANERRSTSHTKIPDEAPEDELGAEAEATPASRGSPQIKAERSMSIPVASDVAPLNQSAESALSSTIALAESTKESSSTGVQKPSSEPPKALRSRSFASAANPLVSMDNANVESNQPEKKRKQQKDATSAMMAISSRSGPASPSETPEGQALIQATLWEGSKKTSSSSSSVSDHNEPADQNVTQNTRADSPSQTFLPRTPTSLSSRSTKSAFSSDIAQPRPLQADNRSSTGSEKRQSIAAISAATAAAKTWGWGVINRHANQKHPPSPDPARAGTPQHPIGRGRPLPPPGQPLPLPEGFRGKAVPLATPKRKPVASPDLSQRKQDEVKSRPVPIAPPPLPARKRQGSVPLDHASDEGMLVVEAPPEDETSSPIEDKSEEQPGDSETEIMGNEEAPPASVSDVIAPDDRVSTPESDSAQGEQPGEADKQPLSSRQSVQEEEARSESEELGAEEHS